jgi:hypothetical protein
MVPEFRALHGFAMQPLMLFAFSVLPPFPSQWKHTKKHSELPRGMATTSMTRWSLPLG